MHLRLSPRFLLLITLAAWLTTITPAALAAQDDPDAASRALLALLETGDPLQQEQAAQELAAIASPALTAELTRILNTAENPRPAASVLGAIGSPAALTALVSVLGDETLTPRRNAAQLVLLEKNILAVPALVGGLHKPSSLLRQHAAQVLGFIKSGRADNALLRVAQEDEDARVRQEAVWALGEIGSTRMQPALKAISRSDPDPEVRIEAERAMLRAGEGF